MPDTHLVDALHELARSFGRDAMAEKLRLLRHVPDMKAPTTRRLRTLVAALNFMQAYPDSPAVLAAVQEGIASAREMVVDRTDGDPLYSAFLNTGLPGSSNAYTYTYPVLQRMTMLYPGTIEIDWEADFDDSALCQALVLALTRGEMRGLEDGEASLEEWLLMNRTQPAETCLEVALRLLRESSLNREQQDHVFETCAVPVTYHLRDPGSGLGEARTDADRVVFQKKPVARETFPLRPRILKPLNRYGRLPSASGQRMIDRSLTALCSRNLEIYPLVNANADDVTLVECGRGLQVLLVGMRPDVREVPESLFFFLIIKNAVPIAYGPASVFLGCCEMGINLFPEFRGGEIRFIYAQLMRALHHLAGVQYFWLTRYGMGEDNKDALKSGAFWFYRKLGFRATNPDVEARAREEEALMRRSPGYRCSLATLRELSHTEAHFDLSGGRCSPVDFGRLGLQVSRCLTEQFSGDRALAQRAGARSLCRILGSRECAAWSTQEKRALAHLAPVLAVIPDLDRWPARDKRSLRALIKSKGARSELGYARRVSAHERLRAAILEAGDSWP